MLFVLCGSLLADRLSWANINFRWLLSHVRLIASMALRNKRQREQKREERQGTGSKREKGEEQEQETRENKIIILFASGHWSSSSSWFKKSLWRDSENAAHKQQVAANEKNLRHSYRWTTLLGRVVIGNRKLLKATVLLLLLRFAKLWSKLASRPALAPAAPALQCDKIHTNTKMRETMINVDVNFLRVRR